MIVGLNFTFAGGLHFLKSYRFCNREVNGVKLKKIESFGVGMHWQDSSSYTDFDLIFPHTVKFKVNYDGTTESVSVDAKDTDLNLGMEVMSC